MGGRRPSLAAALALVALPAAVALGEAAAFRARHRETGSMRVAGERREWVLHVPRGYDPSRPAPLVISLHGAGLWGAAQREISGWSRLADEHGFLVVYPSGVAGSGPRIWRAMRGPGLERDVRFIAALIDTLAAAYRIDRARVYANGLSNGGGMSYALSCRLPGRIAAVGMVAAAHTLPWSWCEDPRPMPAIAFHGTADPQVPYRGGRTYVAPRAFPDVPRWMASWARRNGCRGEPAESSIAPDVTRISWEGCVDGASVVLMRIEGGGHTWPGGGALPEWLLGRTTQGVDASREMWAFFRRHSRRGP